MKQLESILRNLIQPLLEPETYSNLLTKLIIVLIYVLVAFLVTRILNKIIAQFFKVNNKSKKTPRAKRSKTLITLVQNVVGYLIWFITGTTILSKFGISVESILAGAGVVGLAIGFGAQTLVKDIITGFFIIFENQFDVGDYVSIKNNGSLIAEGTVKSIGLRSTRIMSITGELSTIPNGTMSEVTNFSVTNGVALVDIPISTSENIELVEQKLGVFLKSIPKKYEIFIDTPQVLGVDAIESYQVTLRVSAETSPGENFMGARILRREIKGFLQAENIEAPVPNLAQMYKNMTQPKS
ncbi:MULTISPECIES: mechanosensitive ion channel family protein [Staphylococcus]|uniref:Mechanosensitive ion channel family protein n=1 Tax=Staphylococcus chromogenes TaxID=46126 RepID=A0AAX0ZDN0_STACR|nr:MULTISPECIES: mechanosensitive ion channel family protein [Staphylococcus]KDP12577.1 transporter, small conductance mechanosensitive ion channel (MscS) family protein [Staphylococcus chromogenes MU 970]MBP0046300.1 mechanosensitive ion channel family protein [Staphylococcus chromogenes]MBV5137785.1 mechanosensitive ion channel family protein [Staphylococcus chromogenes]MBW6089354.1 mechanosensitive ion channel family protein [Staphylococcus chromogenes]MCD9060113.1 mechanosensitive ion chan